MGYEQGSRPATHRERRAQRRGVFRRIIGAIFATVLGVLAFVGLLVVAAIVLIVVVL
jgi:cell division septal protein FtsQ